MSIPLQITFHELPSSPAVEAQIRERVENLERHCDRLISCRVIVEGRHRAQRPAQQFHLRVELTLPGRIIAVGKHPAEYQAHDDVFVAVRSAFDAARRQLDHHAQRRRRDVKHQGRAEAPAEV